MVHEVERIISQKIRIAEQIPVSWQKDQVWKNIKIEPGSHRTLMPYYAAASILLATSLIVYFMNNAEQEQSSQKIMSLEVSMSDYSKAQTLKADQPLPISQDCEPVPPQKTFAKQAPIPSRKHESSLPKPIAIVLPHADPEESVPKTETAVQVAQPELEPIQEAHRIEAIIGVIPPPQMKAVTAKVKKVKFKFLRGNDSPEDRRHTESYSTLTARIN